MTSVSKIIELRTDSETSVEDVIEDGIRQADETIRNVCNVWIKNKEILIANGSPKIYQLHLKLIFRLE